MAILVIYIVLGILYESFMHPLTILSGLPAAAFGALATLMLFHMQLDLFGFVGIIMMGRKRIKLPLAAASAGVVSPARSMSIAKSTTIMAFFLTMPMSMMRSWARCRSPWARAREQIRAGRWD